jgi:hypothetical protein
MTTLGMSVVEFGDSNALAADGAPSFWGFTQTSNCSGLTNLLRLTKACPLAP